MFLPHNPSNLEHARQLRKQMTRIEIDGSQHFEEAGQESDARRTRYLESLGLLVVRYSNRESNQEFRAVCENTDRLIRERTRKK